MSKGNREEGKTRSGGSGSGRRLGKRLIQSAMDETRQEETTKTITKTSRPRRTSTTRIDGSSIKHKSKEKLGEQKNTKCLHKKVYGGRGGVGACTVQRRKGSVVCLRGGGKSTHVHKKEIKKGKISFKRQTSLFNPQKDASQTITIAGIGNAGSQSAIALSRLGFAFFKLYDFDKVEGHNLSSQYYNIKDIGKTKTQALTKIMKSINPDILSITYNTKYKPEDTKDGILICGVDSLEDRKKFCQAFKKQEKGPELIIDARMGGGQIEIYTMESMEEWEETLNVKPVGDPCAARYISYVSMITGSLIANQIKRYCRKESYKKNILFHIDTLQLITK